MGAEFGGRCGPPVWIVSARSVFLQRALGSVDTPRMIDFEWEMLDTHPEWRLVLETYRAQRDSLLAEDPEHEGWLPRLHAIEGVEEEHIPRIHGKLIALGFLKFQITGRTSGVVYQVTAQACRALSRGTSETAAPVEESEAVDVN